MSAVSPLQNYVAVPNVTVPRDYETVTINGGVAVFEIKVTKDLGGWFGEVYHQGTLIFTDVERFPTPELAMETTRQHVAGAFAWLLQHAFEVTDD